MSLIELRKQTHKGKDFTEEYEAQFIKTINDDLNTPEAMQIFHKTLDEFDFAPKKKLKLLEKFDSILGLGVKDMIETQISIPKEIKKLIEEREKLRENKMWEEADILRQRIKEAGYLIEDTQQGQKITKF